MEDYSHDLPPDLVSRLKDGGFAAEEAEAVLVAPVEDIPSTSVDAPVEVQRLRDPDQIEDYLRVSSQVWGQRSSTTIVETMRSDPDYPCPADPGQVGLLVLCWSV